VKILTSPGVVQIPASISGRGLRSVKTGRNPCFAQVWRDCTSKIIYYVFHDGSIYAYLPDAIPQAIKVITAYTHGLAFNSGVRRTLGLGGTYNRVGSIPGTAIQIYSDPPYPGIDPGPCPNFVDWSWFYQTAPPVGNGTTVVLSVSPRNNNFVISWNPNGIVTSGILYVYIIGNYDGPALNANLSLTISALTNPSYVTTAQLYLEQSGTGYLFYDLHPLVAGTINYNWPIVATVGTDIVDVSFFVDQTTVGVSQYILSGTITGF